MVLRYAQGALLGLLFSCYVIAFAPTRIARTSPLARFAKGRGQKERSQAKEAAAGSNKKKGPPVQEFTNEYSRVSTLQQLRGGRTMTLSSLRPEEVEALCSRFKVLDIPYLEVTFSSSSMPGLKDCVKGAPSIVVWRNNPARAKNPPCPLLCSGREHKRHGGAELRGDRRGLSDEHFNHI